MVLGEAVAAFGCGVTKLLELLAGRRLAGANALLDLTPGRRFALSLDTRCHPLQPILPLDLSHDGFLPLVVVTVAGDAAVKADTVGHDMNVLVLGVDVPSHDELVFI